MVQWPSPGRGRPHDQGCAAENPKTESVAVTCIQVATCARFQTMMMQITPIKFMSHLRIVA